MKVFFDTNIYVAEALLGAAAEQMLHATEKARWRMFCNSYVLDEIERVLVDRLGFSSRFGMLTREHIRRRATLVKTPASRHVVPADPADSPILSAAIAAGADLLVTNDSHLLAMTPYQGLRVISMADYFQLLIEQGHLSPRESKS